MPIQRLLDAGLFCCLETERMMIMDFGQAIEVLKQGEKVARKGWNEKGMWLTLVPAWSYNPSGSVPSLGLEKLSWIGMKTADDKFVPWLASQTDMLSEDWTIVSH
ncbi:DUF2829 domain-containing protein [Paenibacillus ihumii]|uniref:DUF2829 domain-containing protein n=1 Tax=Paenibacillus ihumii TaxID=687436 RepID=UPI001E3D5850|nr:DUF2829 domain-containing protein [Paenibacillus ihumii]